MAGGIAVRANLLCVTWSAAQGHVFLFDLDARQRVSAWTLPPSPQGWSDAAGVAIDEHFHLFVADPHNGRVRHFSAFGRHLGDLGAPAAAGGDAARDRPGVLDHPRGVALHGDVVLVAQGERPRRRGVQRFTPRGEVLRPLASGGDVEATFGAPCAVFADAAGILVADTLNGRIQRFRADGTFVAHVACAAPGQVSRPVAVVRHGDGLVFVDRGDDPGLVVLTAAGQRRRVADFDAHCRAAVGLCRDAQGRLYVLDQGGERVLRFARDLAFVDVVVDLAERDGDYPPPASPGAAEGARQESGRQGGD